MKSSVRRALVTLTVSVVGWAGCGKSAIRLIHDAATPSTSFSVSATSLRQLDMVFMIDNSAMAPKAAKMIAQFPKMIAALRDPTDGTLPDLRIAIIDSDLGTGGAYSSGSCGPKTLPDGTTSSYGDLGRFQMIGAPACGVTSSDALYLETKGNTGLNFNGDINSVFACLAGNLGTLGCGEEHQLQAFEFALVVGNIGNQKQWSMLRPQAHLALVFITDEDDCSAAPNDGVFGVKSELQGESASLRCATRAHQCNGTYLADSPPGYPTTASFSAPFSTCAARTDDCPSGTDTTEPTNCSPLRGVKVMADEIKSLKAYPDQQIVVAGIFGWPLGDADMAAATYKIAPIPNPNTADTAHPMVYDLWPICYDPNHKPANGTDFDPSAVGFGAAPGLRLAAFVDEFGDNGLKFSICQTDLSNTMSQIGAKLAKQVQSRCLPASFAQHTGCTAHFAVPFVAADGSIGYSPGANAVPVCDDHAPVAPCYTVTADAAPCAMGEYLIQAVGADTLTPGTMLELTCQ
jgi:hypothetical protein